jgi:hypothetical protein
MFGHLNKGVVERISRTPRVSSVVDGKNLADQSICVLSIWVCLNLTSVNYGASVTPTPPPQLQRCERDGFPKVYFYYVVSL